MPSGKTHALIGLGASAIIGYALIANNFNISNFDSFESVTTNIEYATKIMIPLVSGSLLGSLIVDIDAKRSKASRAFAKSLTAFVLSAIVINLFIRKGIDLMGTTSMVLGLLNRAISYITNSFGMLMFAMITILGKLSPHRGFTHKWFGTLCFLFSAYISMKTIMFIGFSTGYVLHLLADNYLTKEKIYFFKFRLPCQNANGKINIVW